MKKHILSLCIAITSVVCIAQTPAIREFIPARALQDNSVVINETPESLLDADTDIFFLNAYKKQKKDFTKKKDSLARLARITTDFERLTALKTAIQGVDTNIDAIKNKISEAYKKQPHFSSMLPSLKLNRRAEIFERVYSKGNEQSLYFANQAGLQFNGDGGIFQSELATAYLGALRINFGTLLTNSTSEESEEEAPEMPITDRTEAFQRLLAGGGNTYVSAELPLGLYQDNRTFVYMNVVSRLSLEIAEFSSDVNVSTGNGSIGTNFYASVSTDNNEFNFFVNADFGWYFGGSAFFDRLELEEKKSFGFGKVSGGVTIQNNVRFTLTLNTFGTEENLNSGKVVLGTQILSNLFKKKEDNE